MGSLDGCGKCGNTVLVYGYFVHDETGEVIPEISCIKCGWRFVPPPKCTEPSCAEPPDHIPPPPKKQKNPPNRTRPNQRGRCRNCGRLDIHLAAYGLCDYCYYAVDKVEAAWKAINGWTRRKALKMHPMIRETFLKHHYEQREIPSTPPPNPSFL